MWKSLFDKDGKPSFDRQAKIDEVISKMTGVEVMPKEALTMLHKKLEDLSDDDLRNIDGVVGMAVDEGAVKTALSLLTAYGMVEGPFVTLKQIGAVACGLIAASEMAAEKDGEDPFDMLLTGKLNQAHRMRIVLTAIAEGCCLGLGMLAPEHDPSAESPGAVCRTMADHMEEHIPQESWELLRSEGRKAHDKIKSKSLEDSFLSDLENLPTTDD